ncbi:MAG: hypothetical protein E7537_00025 [Ruminococcaceae bacterium]|nr:hypothetical protein [Oscillospiraceae bacterium]
MKSCTFIGHRDTPKEIEPILETALNDLIINKKVTKFYVGTHGSFDNMAQRVLGKLKKQYDWIDYSIVLAYIPKDKEEYKDYLETIYPDGLEKVPKKYAIIERNKWMIKKCDFLVCYVEHTFSNSYSFKEFAEKTERQFSICLIV